MQGAFPRLFSLLTGCERRFRFLPGGKFQRRFLPLNLMIQRCQLALQPRLCLLNGENTRLGPGNLFLQPWHVNLNFLTAPPMLAQLHLQLIQLRRFVLAFCCRSVHLLGNRWKRYFTKQGLPLALCLLPGGSPTGLGLPSR